MMASQAKGSTAGKLTGRKVLMIFCGAFTIIIGVNILLMVKAIDTFSGLVVPNSYVASQEFNTKRAAQVALGWNAAIDYHDGAVYLTLLDDAGKVCTAARAQHHCRQSHDDPDRSSTRTG